MPKNCIDEVLDYTDLDCLYNFQGGDECFIAGGSVYRAYMGQPLRDSDVDFFCVPSYRDFLEEHLLARGFIITKNNPVATTLFDPYAQLKIQAITHPVHKHYDTYKSNDYTPVTSVLSTFDLSVCQMAYIGGRCLFAKDVQDLCNDNKLRILRVNQSTYQRLVKYQLRNPLLVLDLDHQTTVYHYNQLKDYLITGFQSAASSFYESE